MTGFTQDVLAYYDFAALPLRAVPSYEMGVPKTSIGFPQALTPEVRLLSNLPMSTRDIVVTSGGAIMSRTCHPEVDDIQGLGCRLSSNTFMEHACEGLRFTSLRAQEDVRAIVAQRSVIFIRPPTNENTHNGEGCRAQDRSRSTLSLCYTSIQA